MSLELELIPAPTLRGVVFANMAMRHMTSKCPFAANDKDSEQMGAFCRYPPRRYPARLKETPQLQPRAAVASKRRKRSADDVLRLVHDGVVEGSRRRLPEAFPEELEILGRLIVCIACGFCETKPIAAAHSNAEVTPLSWRI